MSGLNACEDVTSCKNPLFESDFLKRWILFEDSEQNCGWVTNCGLGTCNLCKSSFGDVATGIFDSKKSYRIIGEIRRI